MIEENHLPTLIDLLQQIDNLTLPSGRFFLKRDNTSPYYKMVSNYFSKGGSPISKETVKNYFGDKDKNISPKALDHHVLMVMVSSAFRFIIAPLNPKRNGGENGNNNFQFIKNYPKG